MKRVAITGLGAVSPLGHNVRDTFNALLDGRSGIGPITKFDASEFASQIAGEVKELDVSHLITRKEAKRMDTFIHYAIVAAHEALGDSGLALDRLDLNRFGAVVGSGIGGLPMIEKQHKVLLERGPRRLTPFFIPSLIINLAAGHVSIKFGLKGPSSAPATACATGSHALGEAYRIIQRGEADYMIAGGSEAVVTALAVGGFSSMKALSTRNDAPTIASRPFDVDRDGFVLGEGCGILVLEDLDQAKRRGARIYAELAGFGMSSDAFHITLPSEDGDGPVRVMKAAIADAGIRPDDVDLINAHGTSTPSGDIVEAIALHRVFGTHVEKLMVHSTKSMTGHLLGAAGGIEAVVMAKTLETGLVHATANLENQDPKCNINVVSGSTRESPIQFAISNSFGFGGTNAALVMKRV